MICNLCGRFYCHERCFNCYPISSVIGPATLLHELRPLPTLPRFACDRCGQDASLMAAKVDSGTSRHYCGPCLEIDCPQPQIKDPPQPDHVPAAGDLIAAMQRHQIRAHTAFVLLGGTP